MIKKSTFNIKRIFYVLISLCLTSLCTLNAKEMTSKDLMIQMNYINQDIENIRLELGISKTVIDHPIIKDAASHEVVFQAITLCEKAKLLRFEWTRTIKECPPLDAYHIKLSDVQTQLNTTLKHLQKVKERFKMDSLTNQTNQTNQTEIFEAIMESNQHLNKLLRKHYSPDDVYRKVTRAIYYNADLLKKFSQIKERIPPTPSFESKKTPTDVYMRLIRSFELLSNILNISNKDALHFEINEKAKHNLVPSDVYDVATLLVSELSYLYLLSGGKDSIKSYQPSPKTPSDVYQRAGILLKQLQILHNEVEKNPNWLNKDL